MVRQIDSLHRLLKRAANLLSIAQRDKMMSAVNVNILKEVHQDLSVWHIESRHTVSLKVSTWQSPALEGELGSQAES